MTDYIDLALKYGGFTSLDRVYLEQVAIMGNREYIDDIEVISGWIAEKNKWKLEEFYD